MRSRSIVSGFRAFLKAIGPLFFKGLIFFSFACSSYGLSDFSGAYPVRTYTSQEYGVDGHNWQVMQTTDGRLLFANRDGLLVFDGEHWVLHSVGTTLRGACLDSADNVWVVGDDEFGYFPLTSGSIGAYHSLMDRLPAEVGRPGHIWQVADTREGIVIISDSLLMLWDGERLDIQTLETPRRLVYAQIGETPLISQRGTGALTLRDGQTQLYIDQEQINDDAIHSVVPLGDGAWLFGTFRNGFYRQSDGEIRPFSTGLDSLLETDIVYKLIQLKDGSIACATNSSGILIMSPGGELLRQISKREGLLSNIVFNLYQDDAGDLWACHENGLSCVMLSSNYTTFGPGEGLDVSIVFDLAMHDETLFAGCMDGVYRLDPPGENEPNAHWHKMGSFETPIWHSISTPQGLLTAGLDGLRLNTDENFINLLPSKQDFVYLAELKSESDSIYAGTYGQILELQIEQGGLSVIKEYDVPAAMWTMVLLDEDTAVFGTIDAGLYELNLRADDGKPAYREIVDPLSNESFIWGTVSELEGGIVAFTNAGIFCKSFQLKSDWHKFRHGPQSLGIDTYDLNVFERNGSLWVVYRDQLKAESQLAKMTWRASEPEPSFTIVESDVLATQDKVQCLYVEADEQVAWYGGNDGIVREELNAKDPPLKRGPIIVNAQLVDEDGEPQEAQNEGYPFPVQLAGFRFAMPYYGLAPVTYQTRLLGYEGKWGQRSSVPLKEYTNLSEGNYKFEVRAWIGDELAPEIASMSFTVLPPWYRTPWAYALFVILAVGMVLGIIQWRTNRLRRANVALEKAIRARTIELERTNIRLAQANTAKNRFLASISHEIRNPMNGIVGLARLLRDAPEKMQRERFQHLISTAESLKQMLDSLLDFAAIENGKVQIYEGKFELLTILEEVKSLNLSAADEKGIELSFQAIEGDCPSLLGDAVKIKQIIFNLVNNALKFTEQGKITVRAVMTPDVEAGNCAIQVEVEDTGLGISESQQARIFEQFQRANASNPNAKGLGLGLSISDRLAKLFGGSLSLVRSDASGSCFRLSLTLPIVEEAPAEDSANKTVAANIVGKCVLVVEDEKYNQLIVQGVLEAVGLEVQTASTIDQAKDIWVERAWDFILLDLNLNGRSGLDLARGMAAEHGPRPVLLMSAYVNDIDLAELKAIGVMGYITKPFSPEELLNAIEMNALDSPDGAVEVATPSKGPSGKWNALEYIAGGDADKLNELKAELRSTLLDYLSQVHAFTEAQDFSGVRSTLHDMAPSVRMMDHERALTILHEMRNAAEMEKEDDLFKLVTEFREIAASE